VQVAIVRIPFVNKNHLLYNNAPSVTLAFASMNILGFQDNQNSWCNFVCFFDGFEISLPFNKTAGEKMQGELPQDIGAKNSILE
jgi:hypothetical protein